MLLLLDFPSVMNFKKLNVTSIIFYHNNAVLLMFSLVNVLYFSRYSCKFSKSVHPSGFPATHGCEMITHK